MYFLEKKKKFFCGTQINGNYVISINSQFSAKASSISTARIEAIFFPTFLPIPRCLGPREGHPLAHREIERYGWS